MLHGEFPCAPLIDETQVLKQPKRVQFSTVMIQKLKARAGFYPVGEAGGKLPPPPQSSPKDLVNNFFLH